MANLPEDAGWVEGVRAIEETDPVRFDIYNESLSALASRTKYLQENMGQGGGGSSPVVWVSAEDNQISTSELENGAMYILDTRTGMWIDVVCDSTSPIGTELHFVCAGDPQQVYFIDNSSGGV